jgi:hypothetical protein
VLPSRHGLVAAALIAVAAAGAPRAEEAISRPRNETSGLAVSGGFGHPYGGFGAQVAYFVPIRRWAQVAPFAGLGAVGTSWPFVGAATGVSGCFGYRNRLIVEGTLGFHRVEELSLHGSSIARQAAYAAVVAAGYERLVETGTLFRLTVGRAFPFDSRLGGDFGSPAWAFSIGLGRKLW